MHDTAFNGLMARYYDRLFGVPEHEIEFYAYHALSAVGPLLEVGSGTGSILLPLCERGVSVEGVESSADMIAECRRKANVYGVNPTLYHVMLENLVVNKPYGMIYLPSGVFQLISVTDGPRVIVEKLFELLAPGGTVLIQFFNDKSPESNEVLEVLSDADTVIEVNVHHVPSTMNNNVLERIYTFTEYEGGAVKQKHAYDYYWPIYDAGNMSALLEQRGFVDLEWYYNYETTPARYGELAYGMPMPDAYVVSACRPK